MRTFHVFTVTEIALSSKALGQFDDSHVLAAARLLADARVDVIGWSGTSAGWLGFEHDVTLCQRITEETGIPATTSMLALNEILNTYSLREFGLVTPYTSDVQKRILDNYHNAGFAVVAENHLGISENFAYAEVTAETLTAQVRRVAEAGGSSYRSGMHKSLFGQLGACLGRRARSAGSGYYFHSSMENAAHDRPNRHISTRLGTANGRSNGAWLNSI